MAIQFNIRNFFDEQEWSYVMDVARAEGLPAEVLAAKYFADHMKSEFKKNGTYSKGDWDFRKTGESLKESAAQLKKKMDKADGVEQPKEIDKNHIDYLELDTRPYNALNNAGLTDISELVKFNREHLRLNIDGMGKKSLDNIEEKLWEITGLELAKPQEEEQEEEGQEEEEGEEELELYEEEESDDDIGFDIEEEESLMKEIRNLKPTKHGVKRAFDIFVEAWGIDDENEARFEAGQVAKGVYTKGDESTYADTINEFYQSLPVSNETLSELSALAEDIENTNLEQIVLASTGKDIQYLTVFDGIELIKELKGMDEDGFEF